MNSWLLTSLILIILAVVVLVVCIIAVIGPMKKIVTILLAHLQGIQKQLNGIQTQATLLTATIDKMQTDIEFKKQSVQSVIQSVKDTGTALNQVSDASHEATSKVMNKANQDPQRQAQVMQWTNTAMSFLKRKAQ